MIVPGRQAVSQTGAFTYTIPIVAPPGTAGMAPSLSLNYSSQGGDGFVGLGWSLGGLSTITHCPRTIEEDTVHGGVNYDPDSTGTGTNDRFCLDGQRLILISGTGAYGADSSQYQTEIDSFRKIIAHGTAGHGPSWFEVHLKTGQVLQYGNTTNSQILAVGKTTARVWAVNQVTDTVGNYYTVTYTNDTTNGQFYPSRIDYTGNASASLSTYNSVQFSYTTRTDIVPYYQAGSLQQTTVLLTDVKTYNGSTEVFDYQLAYNAASSNASHDELKSVTQCDASTNCFAPTTFGWQGSRDVLTTTTTSNSLAQGVTLIAGDFNADGLTDAVVLNTSCPSGGDVYFGSQTGTFSSGNIAGNYGYYPTDSTTLSYYNAAMCFAYGTPVFASDTRGYGIPDIIFQQTQWTDSGGTWTSSPYWIDLMNYCNVLQLNWSTYQGNGAPTLSGDFNGDGRMDVISTVSALGSTYTWLNTSNGDGTFTSSIMATSGAFAAGDFDGDGCTDVLTNGSGYTLTYSCNPAVASVSLPSAVSSAHQVVYGDFNGDGKTDILVITSSGATLYLSTGTGFTSGTSIPSSSSWANYYVVAGDWNGDGKSDIALISQTSGTPHQVYLSTGTGFELEASISNSDSSVTPVVADWNNDGADDIWLKKASGDAELLFSYVPELMTSVSNGVGATVTAAYDRLNHGTIYTKGTGWGGLIGPYYVVSQLSTSNGIGGNYNLTYAYTGAGTDLSLYYPTSGPRSNLLNRAFQTFSTMAVTDAQSGIVQTTNFGTTYPYYGLRSSVTVTSGAITLQQTTNTFTSTNAGGRGAGAVYYFNSLQTSAVTGADLSGTAYPSISTSFTYDSYGNMLTKIVSISGTVYQTVTNTYNNDTTDWFLGQKLTTQVQNIVGSSNLTRNWSFAYNSQNLPNQSVVEPGVTALSYTDTIGYDAYGNKNDDTITGSGITTRSAGVTYDSFGEFPITVTNALSQSDQFTFNAAFGETLTHKDPNSVVSSATYDTLGRTWVVTKPDGNKTAMTYLYCSGVNGGTASCPTYGAYLMQATPENSTGGQNGAESIIYYDALGRTIATDIQGFSGSWVRMSTQYNANLQVSETSRPYFVSGGTPAWTTYTHDALGRVTLATFPDTSTTSYGYNALITTVTNAASETTTTTKSAQGLVASVEDANSKTTSYVYDAFGDVTSVTDPLGNVITNTFDLRGRKTAMSDPDMGSWSYTYDVLSELKTQISPNEAAASQSTTLTYDLLGRMTTQIYPDLGSQWIYDGRPNGIGKPDYTCNTDPCSGTQYEQIPSYDTYGRTTQEKLKRDSVDYIYNLTYNSDGRLATERYPSGFIAKYVYNTYGYLSEIVDNSTGTVYWTANARDAELHLLQATAGNGVVTNQSFNANTGTLATICATSNSGSCDGATANFAFDWDTIGRLTSRSDTYEGYTENFCYDSLNRLTNSALGSGVSSCTASGSGVTTKTVGYDALGDITYKSDVYTGTGTGIYTYPTSGSGAVRPHAVSSISGTVNGVANPTFTYDANGNMTAGDGRSVTWTSYNMPATVTEGSTTSAFLYTGSHDRMQQCVPNCTSPTTTTYYLNDPVSGTLESEVVSGSTTTWQDFLTADGGIVAELFKTGTTTTPYYFNGDHLGSASVLTKSDASIQERDSYDAWGKRRNPNGTDNTACSITSTTTRGYTGQEMMDPVCLIELNARIYDPTIARVISPDSVVSDPVGAQGFNRYSYVENGPPFSTDPSGHVDRNGGLGWGMPCWECSGEGLTTDSAGNPESVTDYAANAAFDSFLTALSNALSEAYPNSQNSTASNTDATTSQSTPGMDSSGVSAGGGLSAGGEGGPNPNNGATDQSVIETVVVTGQRNSSNVTSVDPSQYGFVETVVVTAERDARNNSSCMATVGAALGICGTAAVAGALCPETAGGTCTAEPFLAPACGAAIATAGISCSIAKRPPTGSRPIDQTPWAGDHRQIKSGVGAGAADSVYIDQNGNVWVENPDGTWENYGHAGTFTGSGKPSGN
jgi:RHS repeat-associated protein